MSKLYITEAKKCPKFVGEFAFWRPDNPQGEYR